MGEEERRDRRRPVCGGESGFSDPRVEKGEHASFGLRVRSRRTSRAASVGGWVGRVGRVFKLESNGPANGHWTIGTGYHCTR